MDESKIDDSYKVVFVGESDVGKTSLVVRFCRETFNPHEEPTLGAAFLSKTFQVDNRLVKLDIWDTAGQERFRAIVPMYYRDASVAIVCYDITSYDSFLKAKSWIKEIRSNLVVNQKGVTVALVGNKIDLSQTRKVEKGEASQLAAEREVLYFECSAKTGDGVKEFFSEVVKKLPGGSSSHMETLCDDCGKIHEKGKCKKEKKETGCCK